LLTELGSPKDEHRPPEFLIAEHFVDRIGLHEGTFASFAALIAASKRCVA
jgi:hypothetical protein